MHFPNDPYALNAYGLILERQKLYNPSVQRFTNALKYVENEKQKDLLNINLARILVQQGNYEEAIKLCMSIKEASFVSHCQLALSLFKGKYTYIFSFKIYIFFIFRYGDI